MYARQAEENAKHPVYKFFSAMDTMRMKYDSMNMPGLNPFAVGPY
jgi:hypothetical protein